MPPSRPTDDGPPVGNYLYLSSPRPGVDHSCFASIDSIAPGETHLVVITTSLEATIDRWQAVHDESPANVSIVGVGEETRSAAGRPQASGSSRSGTVWPVPHPGDLTGLGIAITEILSQRSGGAGRLVVCFEALEAVLQYASVKPTFRFLPGVTTRMRQAGAVAHYHVGDFQVEGQQVDPFKSLFDGVIEPSTSASESSESRHVPGPALDDPRVEPMDNETRLPTDTLSDVRRRISIATPKTHRVDPDESWSRT